MAALKYSRQRESIKNYLRSREDHPTADMIYTNLRKEFPNISLGTIYRNLSLLVQLGEINKIPTDGPDRYDARTTSHCHFICRGCGRVQDVMVSMKEPFSSIEEQWKYGDIEECRINFFGICNQCKKN